MGLEDEKKRTNVVISKEEITPSTFVPKNCTVDLCYIEHWYKTVDDSVKLFY